MTTWKLVRWGVTLLGTLLLLPILSMNVERLAENRGWDQFLSLWWPTVLSQLSNFGNSGRIQLLAVGVSFFAAGLWLNHFVYRRLSYVMHEERLSHKQLLKERELKLQEENIADDLLRKPTQTALDKLAELRNEGIDTVYAVRVSNEQDFKNWKRIKQEWEIRIRGFIEQNFPRADYLFASHLGVVHLRPIEQAFNEEHLRELSFVIRQMDIIEQILTSYRK
jgi:hypothetical protein